MISAVPMSPRRRAAADDDADADADFGADFGAARRLLSAYELWSQGLRVLLGFVSVIAGFLVFDSTAGAQKL